jgi:transposase
LGAAIPGNRKYCTQAKRRISPLEEHENFILGLIKEQPDMTLDEIVAAMKKAKIAASRTAVWRFFDRHDITLKKTLYAEEQRRTDCARARRRWQREQCMFDPAKLVFIDGVLQRRTERRKK